MNFTVNPHYFSQNDEERYIMDFFSKVAKGQFLDVGAYDGVTLSNTRRLALKGWRGICIEPSPIIFPKLLATYQEGSDIQLINGALDTRHRVVEFCDSNGDALGTTDSTNYHKWKDKVKFTKFFIPTLSLEIFEQRFGWAYDFISVDVEGQSVDLVKVIPFHKCERLKMICVEHDNREAELKSLLLPFKFQVRTRNGENIIFVR
jgi:FkbM family methyltransferase